MECQLAALGLLESSWRTWLRTETSQLMCPNGADLISRCCLLQYIENTNFGAALDAAGCKDSSCTGLGYTAALESYGVEVRLLLKRGQSVAPKGTK